MTTKTRKSKVGFLNNKVAPEIEQFIQNAEGPKKPENKKEPVEIKYTQRLDSELANEVDEMISKLKAVHGFSLSRNSYVLRAVRTQLKQDLELIENS